MSDQLRLRRFHLKNILFAAITLTPIFIIGFTLWFPQTFPESDLKWIIGVCLLFSLLGFVADRLISIKFLGGEARLTEMKTARSVDEMKERKKNLQDAATTLTRQQALSVMKSNRFVGDDFSDGEDSGSCRTEGGLLMNSAYLMARSNTYWMPWHRTSIEI